MHELMALTVEVQMLIQLENVAIANALQLEAARRRAGCMQAAYDRMQAAYDRRRPACRRRRPTFYGVDAVMQIVIIRRE